MRVDCGFLNGLPRVADWPAGHALPDDGAASRDTQRSIVPQPIGAETAIDVAIRHIAMPIGHVPETAR